MEVIYLDIFLPGSWSSGEGADIGNGESKFKDEIGCIIIWSLLGQLGLDPAGTFEELYEMLSLSLSPRLREVKYISLGHRADRGRRWILIQVCVTPKAFHLTARL